MEPFLRHHIQKRARITSYYDIFSSACPREPIVGFGFGFGDVIFDQLAEHVK
jgi:hypothetical protein